MDYVRYLHAKATVDDRALNLTVLQSFEAHVVRHAARHRHHRLRIVEVGGGVGAMFMRLLRRGKIFAGHEAVEYTIVDVKQEVLLAAQENILANAPQVLQIEPVPTNSRDLSQSKYSMPRHGKDIAALHHTATRIKDPVELCKIVLTDRISVRLVLGDALIYLKTRKSKYDVLIGAAVMDLWEPEATLKTFFHALNTSTGINAFYLPITFDGTTDLFPTSSEGADIDRKVENAFHRAMGSRKIMGHETLACHTGRRLVPCITGLKATVKSVGGSSWIVSPDKGVYSNDEAYFIACIVDFIQSTCDKSGGNGFPVSSASVSRYLASRRKQISDGTLVYVAHNIDVFGVL